MGGLPGARGSRLLFFLALLFAGLLASFLIPSAQATDNGSPAISPYRTVSSNASGNSTGFSLDEFKGSAFILQITNIENPLCRECEPSLRGQTDELVRLKQIDPGTNIVTINMRKNPYSRDGRFIAESWWQENISWRWIEDFEPYPAASMYMEFWTVSGGFSNPTLLLLDPSGNVTKVYHVYQLGKGEIDGIVKAESLRAEIMAIEASDGNGGSGFKNYLAADTSGAKQGETSWLGMFVLGILTSFSPCSIALMIAVFTYIMNSRKQTKRAKTSGTLKGIESPREGLMIGIAFTIGMAAVFFIIGLFITQLGIFVRSSRFFDLIAGMLMILLGIGNFKPLGEIAEPVTLRVRKAITYITGASKSAASDANPDDAPKKSSLERVVEISLCLFEHSTLIGAFTLGVFFALGWAPCAVSLVFPVIIWLMAQDISPIQGGLMLFVFGLGHGVPIIPIAAFSRTAAGRIGDRYITAGRYTTKIFGLAVIIVGLVYAVRYFGYVLW